MKRHMAISILTLIALILAVPTVHGETQSPVRKTLDNGMTVILQENHRAPIVTLQAWVGAGSLTEEEFSGSGISHFVEHMLFKGTERRNPGQIGREVKEAGGETNAYTGYDKTVYYITFHSGHFDKALDIMSDILMHSVFDPVELENERKVIIKEIQMNRDDPFRHLYMTAYHTAYSVHPYQSPVIGYESLLRALTRDDLLTYYKRLYVPNNITLVVVGDFDTEKALPLIREAFQSFERKSVLPIVVPSEPQQMGPREAVEQFEVKVAQSMMGFHGPSLHSDDMYPMDVLSIVLGSGDTSRLYRELREKKGIVYSISTWSVTPRDPGMFWIAGSFEPENYQAVKDGIWEQIEKLKKHGVSKEELETARAKVLSDYIFSRESVEGQAQSLGSGELDAHDILFDKQYVDSINRVTARDVQNVVEKYFVPENSVIATLMPTDEAKNSESVEEPPRESAVPPIEKMTIDNGLTVLLREDNSTETVSIRLFILGGARGETSSDEGITNLMTETMLKGTKRRSAEDIAFAIESRGGTISSFSGYNSMGFEVNMLSRDVKTGIDVLADVVSNPAFRGEEVEREKTAALASIKSVDDNIFPSSMKLFRQTMFKGHPYSFLVAGDADVVQSLTPADLQKFYSGAVVASRMVLSVFGDIKKDEVLKMVEEEFGRIPRGSQLQESGKPEVAPTKPREAFKSSDKEQTAIMIGFPGVTVGDPDRYGLDILSDFLNSQGGKLFQTLRDQRGLAYSVGAFDILGVDPGAFVLYIMTDPEKTEQAVQGMFEVMDNLRKSGLSDADLERTKTEVTGNHAIELQTNSQITTQATFDELYGLGYNNYLQYDAKINAVTADDMKRVINRTFDFGRYTIIAVGASGSEEALKAGISAAEDLYGAK